MIGRTPQQSLEEGQRLRRQGRLEAACEVYALVLRDDPAHLEAHYDLGLTLSGLRRWEEAVAHFDAAIALAPEQAGPHLGRANALFDLGRPAAALAGYDAVIALEPALASAHNNRGNALNTLGRPVEALASLQAAIEIDPAYAGAFNSQGAILRTLGQHQAAVASYSRAIALSPGFAPAYNNRGNVLYDLGALDEALADYDRALAIDPGYAGAWRNRASALYRQNHLTPAIAAYDQAIRLDPSLASARHDRGLALLQLGDFEEGWRGYEWRKSIAAGGYRTAADGPEWLGQGAIAGARVLVYAEQGLGDTLQFVRFLPRLRARGAEVILQVQPALKSLLAANIKGATVIAVTETPPPFDLHCALMSLPLALGLGPDDFAAEHPYLRADPTRRALWRSRLSPGDKRRIGLVWSGAPYHRDDRNRSVGLQRLVPLLSSNIDWVCLQKALRAGDAEDLVALGHVAFHGGALEDFDDTAALTDLMDLVITVDTSVAHLASALGKPTWLLLPFSPDWRWGLKGETTPWSPAFRLFRQPATGDWSSVIEQLGRALAALPVADI